MSDINKLVFQEIKDFMDSRAKEEHKKAQKTGKIFFDIRPVLESIIIKNNYYGKYKHDTS